MSRVAALLAIVLAGLFSVALLSAPVAVAAGGASALVLGARLLAPRLSRVPWSIVTAATVVLLGVAVYWELPPSEGLALLLVYLQAHRQLTSAGTDDDRVSVLLSALMLVVAAGGCEDPLLAGPLLVWMVALPASLAPAPMPLRTALALAGATSVMSVVLFVVAPRAVPPAAERQPELTGFAPDVDLGAMDALLDDPTVVFRAALTPMPSSLVYWRGVALERFDGQRWSRDPDVVPVTVQAPRVLPPNAVVVDVVLDEGSVLFVPGRPLYVQADGAVLQADRIGGWSVGGTPSPYRVVALPPFGPEVRAETSTPLFDVDTEPLTRFLELPADLDPRIAALAASVAGEGSAAEQIDRLSAHLRSEFRYARRPAGSGLDRSLSSFLFEHQEGHCEYFSTALAVLARSRGIPSRVVNGFAGGDRDVTGWLQVRRLHAHSWIEFYDRGWWPADATPGPAATEISSVAPSRSWGPRLSAWWTRDLLGYDRSDQVSAVFLAGTSVESVLPARTTSVPWLGLSVLAGGWLLLGLLIRWGGPRLARRLLDPPSTEPAGPVARAHHHARRHVSRAGYRIPVALPPLDAAKWLSRQQPGDPTDALVELAWLYYDVHLGGGSPSAAAPQARMLLERVTRLGGASPTGQVTPPR